MTNYTYTPSTGWYNATPGKTLYPIYTDGVYWLYHDWDSGDETWLVTAHDPQDAAGNGQGWYLGGTDPNGTYTPFSTTGNPTVAAGGLATEKRITGTTNPDCTGLYWQDNLHLLAGTAALQIVFGYAPSGGLAAGGGSPAAVAYNETPSGGLTASGYEPDGYLYWVDYNESPGGGLVAGGSADYEEQEIQPTSGGAVAGGSVGNQIAFAPVIEGGAVVAGQSLPDTSVFAPSGGLLASGSGNGRGLFLIIPTAGIYHGKPLSALLAGGLATSETIFSPVVAVGLKAGGTASKATSYGASPAGGLRLDGSGRLVDRPQIGGGLVVGSESPPLVLYPLATRGGLRVASLGLWLFNLAPAATGGVRAGGTAKPTDTRPTTGGVVAGGRGVPCQPFNETTGGGVLFDGFFVPSLRFSLPSVVGLAIAGLALPAVTREIEPKAKVKAGGSCSPQCEYSETTAGGIAAAGGGNSAVRYRETPQDGLLVDT